MFERVVDRYDAALLRELDFAALLMLPLHLEGRCWGLLEVYRAGTSEFEDHHVTLAAEIAADAGAVLEDLQRRAAAA
jgi:GAF domain-containing protein